MGIEQAIAELEKTMDDCSEWMQGTGTRQTYTLKDGRQTQREYYLLDATQAMCALLKAQATGIGADAAIKTAERINRLARWHEAGAKAAAENIPPL